jgi:hypothetical protein
MAASSYAGNIQIFCQCDTNPANIYSSNFINPDGQPKLTGFFKDGTSNTILFGEKYAECWSNAMVPLGALAGNPALFADGGSLWAYDNLDGPGDSPDWFAPWHPGFGLAYWEAITVPAAGMYTIGPASVFQLLPQPFLGNCNPLLASTGHAGGMVICMADASVRTLNANVSGTTWWALMTPRGGEILGNDW